MKFSADLKEWFRLKPVDWDLIKGDVIAYNHKGLLISCSISPLINFLYLFLCLNDIDAVTGKEYQWRSELAVLNGVLILLNITCIISILVIRKLKKVSTFISYIPVYIYALGLPALGAIAASIDQLMLNNITPYILTIMVIALALLSPPWQSVVYFIFAYLVLFVCMPLYQPDHNILYNHRLNGFSVAVIGYGVSIFLWRINLTRFRQSWQIIKQKAAIEDSFEKLSESYATNKKFFSIIAHDLRGPITATVQLSGMLHSQKQELEPKKREQMSKMLHDSLQNTAKLLENLLVWSQSQAGAMPFNPGALELHDTVQETEKLLMSLAADKKITVQNQVPAGTLVKADQDMLRTVLRNLVANSIKFTPDQGMITISAHLPQVPAGTEKMVQVQVQDNGVGMPEKILRDLFKVDKRVTSLGTRKEAGTGLGLVLCKEFVEKNGGQIEVMSQPGKGSTFAFTLPLACGPKLKESTEVVNIMLN